MGYNGAPGYAITRVSDGNSSESNIANGESFTGEWERRSSPQLMIAIFADQDLTFQAQFSTNGSDIDSTVTYQYRVGVIEPPHRLEIAREYFRIVVTNNSGSDTTVMRLETSIGQFISLTSPLNGSVAADADTTITRNIPIEDEVGLGNYAGWAVEQKFGENLSLSTSSIQDVSTANLGAYSGFPTSPPEEFQVLLGNASDIGCIVSGRYLSSYSATDWTNFTLTVNATLFSSGFTGVRLPRARHSNGTTFNAGDITIRWAGTTTAVFSKIVAGQGQTRNALDTIPAENTGLIKRIDVRVDKTQTANITGSLYVKGFSVSPVLIRPFTATNTLASDDTIYAGIPIVGPADVAVRVQSVSANNTRVRANFDYLRKKRD